jgi:predicted DNA binding CopG/RHH family protein
MWRFISRTQNYGTLVGHCFWHLQRETTKYVSYRPESRVKKKEKYMNSKHKPIPQFTSEDDEREFWATHDSTEYIDWSKAKRNPALTRLKPSTRTISIRLPESLIAELKALANKRDVPYQSLVKIFLSEKVKEETTPYLHSDPD